MLVLAEDYASPASVSLEAEQLERLVMDELRARAIAPMAPNFEKVYEMRLSQPAEFAAMSVAALGRLAGAQQVLYMDLAMTSGDLAPGASMYKAEGTLRVKIVDVESGDTLWPADDVPGGDHVRFEQKSKRRREVGDRRPATPGPPGLGAPHGALFYKYKPDEWEEP